MNRKPEHIEARIERLVYGGAGLARLTAAADGTAGPVVLTPMVLPGELVSVEIMKREPRLIQGRASTILEAAPGRIAAACPYFARCGGCHYQHIAYEDQLRYKAEIAVETLRRIGKLETPAPELISGEPWHYRNRVQFNAVKRGKDFRIGYFSAGSDRLVPVDQCPISSQAINEMLPKLAVLGARPDYPQGPSQIEIVDGGTQTLITLGGEGRIPQTLVSAMCEAFPSMVSLARTDERGGYYKLWGPGFLNTQAAGFDFRISHGVFFQVNRFLLDRMADHATRNLQGETVLDLYAGAGYFTLPLAKRFTRVEAVEANPAAVRDMRANCNTAGISNVDVHRAETGEFLAVRQGKRPDAILLDPPRAGLGKDGAKRLAVIGAPSIVYVSCDPPTLSRDLAVLVAKGYRIEKLEIIDLFPQTFHIEAMVTLRLG